MNNIREKSVRMLFGYDIFLSHSRADSASYAARLASELAALGFFCRLDQWGAHPGREVPAELLRDLRRCSMLIVVGSAASGASSAVDTEIREFLPARRFIVPVDLDGSIRSARWWPLLEGLAVEEEPFSDGMPASAPSKKVIERIVNTATFTRRTTRLRRLSVAALLVLAVLAGLAVIAGLRAASNAQRADGEAKRAELATKERIGLEKMAKEQRELAAAATSARQQAEIDKNAAVALQQRPPVRRPDSSNSQHRPNSFVRRRNRPATKL
jgi:TIR domain